MKPKTDQDTTWYIILYIIYTYVTQIMGMSWNLNPTKYDISLANGQWSRLSPLTLFVGLNQKRLSQRPLLVVSARLHPWPAKQRLLLLRRHLRLIVAVKGMNQEVSWETPKPRSHLEWLLDTQWSLLQIISNEHSSCPIPIFSYIYIPWASISQEKRVLQNISIFRVKTRFSFGCIVGGFWRWVVDGFLLDIHKFLRHIHGFSTG